MQEGRVILSDGRRLGFVEGGGPERDQVDGMDPAPPPAPAIFYFHGFPGSRKEAGLLIGAPSASGLRIISVDRPGMGLSDAQPNRSLKDWPRDIAELADQLGIGRFSVLGVSGGGPYAAACAWAMPERVVCAGIVCGPSELDPDSEEFPLGAATRVRLNLLHRFPGLGRPSYAVAAYVLKHWPLMMLDSHIHSLPRCDQVVLTLPDIRETLASSFRDSVRQGGAGGAQELKILCDSWGFDLAEIRTAVALWHGELDPIVPVSMGRQLARQIPGCRASFFPKESHYSLLVNRWGDIMGDMRAMMEANGAATADVTAKETRNPCGNG